jgi:hypothetical protein
MTPIVEAISVCAGLRRLRHADHSAFDGSQSPADADDEKREDERVEHWRRSFSLAPI